MSDHVKRIGDSPESAHYRAEKAGVLLTAAIRLHRNTMLAYGGWPEDEPNEHAVLTAARLLDDIVDVVQQELWQAMRAARATSSPQPSDLVQAGDTLARWAARERSTPRAGGTKG
jgi:hypothetical protein